MQEVSPLSKAAAAKQHSHVQCKTAVADLHERLKQSQQLLDACACTDGSAAVKSEHLQDQLRAARYELVHWVHSVDVAGYLLLCCGYLLAML